MQKNLIDSLLVKPNTTKISLNNWNPNSLERMDKEEAKKY